MKFLDIADNEVVELAATGDMPEAVHQFEPRQIHAINAALAARRPLLIRGEPGIGKSQLARAAAKKLGRAFVSHTVDARTESRDLLWHFDAVARLAEAQLLGALCRVADLNASDPPVEKADRFQESNIREHLAISHFLHPRALWWAFDWNDALSRAKDIGLSAPPQLDDGDSANGCLVLIDEVDKAEADVPNGLLEALGAGCFHPQGCTEPVKATGIAPLVVITTNEERALPDAFVRRCLVLHLRLPSDPKKLAEYLIARGHAHFDRHKPPATDKLLQRAAELLIADRDIARENHWLPLPGQAEYLDLVRAVITRKRTAKAQEALVEKVAEFVLKKHPDAFQRLPEQDTD